MTNQEIAESIVAPFDDWEWNLDGTKRYMRANNLRKRVEAALAEKDKDIAELVGGLEFIRLNLPECQSTCAEPGACVTEKCLKCYATAVLAKHTKVQEEGNGQ